MMEDAIHNLLNFVLNESVRCVGSNRGSILGGCLVNPVEVEGKRVFGFKIGERLVLKYVAKEPDTGFKKFVGSIFKCTVMRYLSSLNVQLI